MKGGTLDLRSLAVCRVLLGLITLYDIARRTVWFSDELEALHTDTGIVPPGDSPHRGAVHVFLFHRGSVQLQVRQC